MAKLPGYLKTEDFDPVAGTWTVQVRWWHPGAWLLVARIGFAVCLYWMARKLRIVI